MISHIPNRRILSALVACGLGLAAIGTIQAATLLGIGSDHPATGVDSAGSRMNIQTSTGTFQTLAAGTYDVVDFGYSTSASVADVQPFLASIVGANA